MRIRKFTSIHFQGDRLVIHKANELRNVELYTFSVISQVDTSNVCLCKGICTID